MLIQNNAEISRIKSDYILKSIFSNIDYKRILKLIKYNKSLQNRLGISLENYKNKSDFPKFEFLNKTVISEPLFKRRSSEMAEWEKCLKVIIAIFFFIPFFFYSILLVFFGKFRISEMKDNYNKKTLDIIYTINSCLFI